MRSETQQSSSFTAGSEKQQNFEQAGHTLTEVVVGMAVLGFMLVSLYAGLSSGFAVLRLARENLRATQILQEKMEVVRLIKWDNVTPGFIPATFTAPFYATDTDQSGGLTYEGQVSIEKAPITESYANELRQVQIDLRWTSGKVTRSRQMTTFVSRYGIQNYIY